MPSVNCPSCGGKVDFTSAVSLHVVCGYCRSLLLRTDLKVEDLGKVAILQKDGSPLQLGARGVWDDTPFTLIGRMQLRYPDGFWNEWFAWFADGRQGWLGEAQGIYAVSFKVEAPGDLPPFGTLKVGAIVKIASVNYKVRDLREAEYLSAEGELPFRPPLGEKAPLADLVGPAGAFATLDFSEDAPIAFTGEYAEFDRLQFAGLKEVEGW